MFPEIDIIVDIVVSLYCRRILKVEKKQNCVSKETMTWEAEQENLLKDWAEKARYYAWMHYESHQYFNTLTNRLTIPLIVISTVTSSANFTMVGYEPTGKSMVSVGFPLAMGLLGMVTAVLSASLKTFKTTEMATEHFAMYKHFNSLFRNITMDLSLPSAQRKPPQELCNVYRYDFDRLINESPTIPNTIVSKFNNQFPFVKNKPEITNDFGKVVIHGRNKMLACSEATFRKIRQFYKYRYYVLSKDANTGRKPYRAPLPPVSLYNRSIINVI